MMTLTRRQKISFNVFLILTAFESLFVIRQLLSIPGDSRRAILGGYSPFRLGMVGMVSLMGIGCLVLIALLNKRPHPPHPFLRLNRFFAGAHHAFWGTLLFLLTGSAAHFLNGALVGGRFVTLQVVALRLAPVLSWAGWLSFQSALLLTLAYFDIRSLSNFWREQKEVLRLSLICIVILLLSFGFLAVSKVGFAPHAVDWFYPNAPVLASQVWMSLALGAGMLWLSPRLLRHRFDIFLTGSLWLVAVLLWQTVPLNPSYFNPQPVPPNFEYYPYSDAAGYDLRAQTLLIGEGFGGRELIFRPLYVFSLAIYHALVGQSYEKTMLIQVMVMAFLPVMIYLLGKALHSRLAGLLAALFILLRERNNIALGGMIHGAHAHARLMMTDVPTELGVVLIALLTVLWLQQFERRRWLPLWIGGAFGALILVRTQTILLLGAVLIVSGVLFARKRARLWATDVLKIILGMVLFLAPWMVRNYSISGMWVLETAPSVQLAYEARYITGMQDTAPLPGERGDAYNARLTRTILNYMLTHPIETVQFTIGHFAHNEVNMILSLPLGNDYNGLQDYVTRHEFWFSPIEQPLAVKEQILLGINLAVIGIGLGATLLHRSHLSWLLLLLNVCYNLSTALARRSGGRFFLPGDWVGIFFYAIGLAQLLIWLALLWKYNRPFIMNHAGTTETLAIAIHPSKHNGTLRSFTAAPSVLMLGALLPLAELIVPPRYTQTAEQVIQNAAFTNSERTHMLSLLERADITAYYGRGLYPRYLNAGEGLRSSEPYRDQNRLRFELIGAQSNDVFLPLTEPPAFFPSGSDVIAIGCMDRGYLDALVVIVLSDSENNLYWRSATAQPPPCTAAAVP